ncbi:MAG: TonB-dependent receptor [Desulfobacteraceae bacterium]|nr:TonB-dependent receptor [Desulfobacteraceae bacterium]
MISILLNDNGTQWNSSDDRWEKRQNAQFDQHNILGKLGYDLAEHTRLDIVSQWFDKSQGLPAWNNSSYVNTSLDTQRSISSLTLTADNLTSLLLNTRTRMDYSWKQEEYDDRGGHIGLGDQHSRYTTERFGANLFAEWLSEHHILQANLDLGYETYAPEDLLQKTTPHDSSRVSYALGIQDSVILFADKLVITPAIRYLLIQDSLDSAESAWGIHLEEISDTKESFSPQIGVKYQASEWLAFKANAAKYFREPSFFEMFGDRGFFIGNPDLKPETGINTDIGAEIRYQMQNKWMQRICVTLVRFDNQADDLITRVYDARGIGKSANIAEAEIDGIEAGISVEFLSHFRFLLNATWQDTEIEAASRHLTASSFREGSIRLTEEGLRQHIIR